MGTSRLSDAQRQVFEESGVLAPLELLSAAETARYRAAFAIMESAAGPIARIDEVHRHFAWAHELATHPRLLDAVASLIGDDLLIHGVLIFCKYPDSQGEVPWHQDSVYSGWHLSPSASAWIALTPSTRANGCMRVVEGSHHEGLRPHDEHPDASVLLRRGETVRDDVDESRVRDLVLAPGQMSLHHSNVIHGSQRNGTSSARIGFIVRFVTSAHRVGRLCVVRARGQGDDRHLDVLEPLSPPAAGDSCSVETVTQETARWQSAR